MREILNSVLSKKFVIGIVHADYEVSLLQGGDIGDVRLITGTAVTERQEILPYKLVLKIQKKWERFADALSWRREYDLFVSDFKTIFTGLIRWPECYHAEISGDETRLWLEYIEGVSGNDLTVEMLECAAFELGRFQGRLHAHKPALLGRITNLSSIDFMAREYRQWHEKTDAYRFRYLYSNSEEIKNNQITTLQKIYDWQA